MNLSGTHLLLLLVIALLLFGPSKLPGLGKSLGESIRGFKKGLRGDDEEDEVSVNTRTPHPKQISVDEKTGADANPQRTPSSVKGDESN